jgi:S-adenosylmethionine hydrolase
VIKRIAPDVEVIDITHGIEPQNVLQGALALGNTLPYMPAGIHVAVVDPTVGSDRRAVCLRAGDRWFVGPDNGLLVPAAEQHGAIENVHALENEAYFLHPISHTFHGRDVFAPAAAHLAAGVAPEELGRAVDPGKLVRLDIPQPEVGDGRLRVTVLYVDRYGNVQVNATGDDLVRAGLEPGARVEVDAGFESYFATVARTFADVRAGDILVAIAINGGDAAQTLPARAGDELRIRRLA